jgi:hypothetical protein
VPSATKPTSLWNKPCQIRLDRDGYIGHIVKSRIAMRTIFPFI